MRPLLVGLLSAGVLDLWDRPLWRPPPRRLAARQAAQPVAGGGAEPTQELEARLAAQLSRLEQQDHFECLGLGRQANTAAVEAAFDGAAWGFHPELFVDREAAVSELAQAILRRLRAAYLVLSSHERRADYLAQLTGPEELAARQASLASGRQATEHFQAGAKALSEGRYEPAARELRRACRLDPGTASYWAHLGWAVHQSAPTDRLATDEAERYFERAGALDPGLELAHLYRGRLALAAGDRDAARRHFGAALALNPESDEATAALARLPSAG